MHLFVVLILILGLLVVDLEVSQLIGVLGRCHHPQPVPEVVLLEVLLGEILQVSLGEGDVGGEADLGLDSLHHQLLSKVVGLATNLMKRGCIEKCDGNCLGMHLCCTLAVISTYGMIP